MLELTDQLLACVRHLLPSDRRRGRPWRDHHQVLGGILWKLHTGRPWRDVPERFGPWQTCYGRLRRWQGDGTWARVWAVGPPTRRAQATTAAARRCWRRRQWQRRARA